jgi:hypothetical protein
LISVSEWAGGIDGFAQWGISFNLRLSSIVLLLCLCVCRKSLIVFLLCLCVCPKPSLVLFIYLCVCPKHLIVLFLLPCLYFCRKYLIITILSLCNCRLYSIVFLLCWYVCYRSLLVFLLCWCVCFRSLLVFILCCCVCQRSCTKSNLSLSLVTIFSVSFFQFLSSNLLFATIAAIQTIFSNLNRLKKWPIFFLPSVIDLRYRWVACKCHRNIRC